MADHSLTFTLPTTGSTTITFTPAFTSMITVPRWQEQIDKNIFRYLGTNQNDGDIFGSILQLEYNVIVDNVADYNSLAQAARLGLACSWTDTTNTYEDVVIDSVEESLDVSCSDYMYVVLQLRRSNG